MKNKKEIVIIILISMILSVFGFVIDLKERVPDIKTNIYEIFMMGAIMFVFISIFYFPIKYIINK